MARAIKERVVRVFVSSTFKDMHSERDYLGRYIFPELQKKCQARGIEFIDLDLRWGVTEEEAQKGGALDICLEEIERSRPYFIGLLGDRYGWIPLPSLISPEKWPSLERQLTEDDRNILLQAYEPDGNRLILKDAVPADLEAKIFALFEACQFAPFDIPESVSEEEAESFKWIDSAPAGNSVTAMEIMHGVLKNPQLKEQTYFYFRDNRFLSDVPPRFHPLMAAESPEAQKKLAELKNSIQEAFEDARSNITENYSCSYDSLGIQWREAQPLLKKQLSPDDYRLIHGMVADDQKFQAEEWDQLNDELRDLLFPYCRVLLKDLEVFGRRVGEDLWSAICRDFPEDEEELTPLDLEIREHNLIAAEKNRLFIGREKLLREIESTLEAEESQGNIMVLEGLPGSGKSAVMAVTAYRLREKFPKAAVVSRFVGASGESQSLKDILFNILLEIERETGVELSREDLKNPSKREKLFKSLPSEAYFKTGEPVFILIDALNQLDPAGKPEKLTWLPPEPQPGVFLLVSAIESPVLKALHNRDYPLVQAGTLTPQEQRELVEKKLQKYRKKLSSEQLEILMTKKESNLPLYLTSACEELRIFPRFEELTARIGNLPDTVQELFSQIFERLEYDFGHELVRSALGLLDTSLYGLKESEFLRLMARDGENELPQALWSPLFLNLSAYMHRGGENGLLGFFHQQCEIASSARYINDESRREFNRRLAQFGSSELPVKDGVVNEEAVSNCNTLFPIYQLRAGMTEEFLEDQKRLYTIPEGEGNFDTLNIIPEELRRVMNYEGSDEERQLLYRMYEKLTEELTSYWLGQHLSWAASGFSTEGQKEWALKYYELSLKVRRRLCEEHPDNMEFKQDLGNIYAWIGQVKAVMGDSHARLEGNLKCLELEKEIEKARSDDSFTIRCIATSHRQIGRAYKELGKMEEGLEMGEKALAYGEKAQEMGPSEKDRDRELDPVKRTIIDSLSFLGGLRSQMGEIEKARDYYLREQDMIEGLIQEFPDERWPKTRLLSTLSSLGLTYRNENRWEEGLGYYRKALVIAEQGFRRAAHSIGARDSLTNAQFSVATMLERLGRLDEAMELYEAALGHTEVLVERQPGVPNAQRSLSTLQNRIAGVTMEKGDFNRAEELFLRALKVRRGLAERVKGNLLYQKDIAFSLNRMGDFYTRQGRFGEALKALNESFSILSELTEASPKNAAFQSDLLVCLWSLYEASEEPQKSEWLAKARELVVFLKENGIQQERIGIYSEKINSVLP